MIELSTHIEYMLLSHQKVGVPQLGTFIASDIRSRRVDEDGIFLPPYRTVSFKWDEQEEGEDFVLSLSKLHNLSRHEARILCVEYVDELQQTLIEEGTISLGSMGYLLNNAESGEIAFMPPQSGIASPAYYGLDAISFAKLSHEVRKQRDKKRAAKKTKLTSVVADQDTITIRINRRAFNYVAAVAASIVLFFAFASPIGNTLSDITQKAEFFFAPKIVATPEATEAEAQPAIQAEPVAEPVQKHIISDQALLSKDYAIVLASAISKKSAVSFAGRLQEQGYKAQACEFGGMVRVIIPGFATQEDAYAEIRKMKADSKDFSHAWPCNVKNEEIKPIE